MVYYYAAGIGIVSILVVALGLIFFRDKIMYFLAAGIICAAFLSFYVFYYISSYSSNPDEVMLNKKLTKGDNGSYILDMHTSWNKEPEIFGFNGNDDLLVLRYNPEDIQILTASKDMYETDAGKTSIKLSKDFNYSQIDKKEREVYFRIKDGAESDVSISFKASNADADVKVFYIHDFKTPLEGSTYWEKDDIMTLID